MKKILAIAMAAMVAGSAVQAAASVILAGWETDGLTADDAKAASFTADTVAAFVNVSSLTRGDGLGTSGTAPANTFYAVGYAEANLAGAVTENDFWQFSIAPVSGTISLYEITYNFRRSSTGPDRHQWQYSLDGFATAGVNIGSEITHTGTTSNGNALGPIDLTGIGSLQGVSGTITIRMYGWGGAGTGTGSYGRLAGEDLVITGIPEPGTLGLLIGAGALLALRRRRR